MCSTKSILVLYVLCDSMTHCIEHTSNYFDIKINRISEVYDFCRNKSVLYSIWSVIQE